MFELAYLLFNKFLFFCFKESKKRKQFIGLPHWLDICGFDFIQITDVNSISLFCLNKI